MTFVSYAQNFEDVLLWRALGHLPAGFYIDVGASHPDIDSVTRAFYDRGWHGLNIEPTQTAHRRLAAARPRDLNLRLALAAQPGRQTFYAVEGADSGLSTLDPAAVARYRALGMAVTETPIETATLAAICRDHAPPDIHFLKIDVEGAERDVLAGADFTTHRPWIILAEATAPMSTAETHAVWEPILLAAEYRFAWFDGLNRFYIAAERHAQLAPAFRTPPNIFDNFVRAADTEYARRLAEAETRAATLAASLESADLRAAMAQDRAEAANLHLLRASAEAARLRDTLAARTGTATRLEAEIESATAEKAHAIRVANEALAAANAAEDARAAAAAWLDAIRGSTSWRVTAPLRRVLGRPAPSLPAPPAPSPATAESPATPPPASPRTPPALRRAVHQFHSGTAVGDAVTNAMFLTRRILRGLGYDSRIFAEHIDPRLAGEIQPIDALPTHDNYVLLLRHSMGHDALDRLLALPAPKILIYHNITPPELLADNPFMQRYAQIGRDQLTQIRPAVRAALADSDYNAIELRQAGFPAPLTCPLLFDLDALRTHAAPRSPASPHILTLLFVGRIAAAKGQLELIDAFHRFRARYPGESRLVLVGRHEPGPYIDTLLATIRRHGFDTGAVELTGPIPDDELRRRYAEADLYVSASKHEGFGVPLVEAVAAGVPVLAVGAGAVPYTLGFVPAGLADPTPTGLADAILTLARDPAARTALLHAQAAALDRYRLEHVIPTLTSALAAAGAAPPANPATAAALAAAARFTVTGHVNGSYSLAEINRALARALEAARPGAVRLIPVENGVTDDVSGIPPAQRAALTPLLARPAPISGPEITVSQHYPVWTPPEPGDLPLAFFFWEESLIPAATAAMLNDNFRGVLAPTSTVAKALIDSGVTIPVRTVGHTPDLAPFRRLRAERAGAPRTGPFTFLHVSSCFPRKGVDLLLAAYARAFRATDDVHLVVKGFPNPHNTVAADLARLRAADPGAPAITLIDNDISEDALLALYRDADALVLPTRGEGYNLPAAEALAAGIPVITTGWGGHTDFLAGAPPAAARLLRWRFAPSATHLATPFSLWVEPDADDLVAALREAVAAGRTPPPAWSPAPPAANIADTIAAIAADLLLAPPCPPPRTAWITTWDVRCGIAEYSRQLLAAFPTPALVLADERTPPTPASSPAWRVGDKASTADLAAAITRNDPEAIVIQHQPGLFPWRNLPTLLDHPALAGRVVCITLHNAQDLADEPGSIRAPALRALARMSRVAVHSVRDLNILAGLGLAENTVFMPHGAPAAPRPASLRDLTPADPILLGCYGFFLPDKGIPQLIRAVAILRRTWPGLRLRLVNAEYPLPQSAAEITACRTLAAAAGLEGAIEFETGFLEHDASAALLAACDLLVLPYQHSKEGSSAALRSTLGTGIPVATTPLPLFEEAGPATIPLPGIAPANLAAGIDRALRDRPGREAAAAAAAAWLADRAWPAIGSRWAALLHALSASKVVVSPL